MSQYNTTILIIDDNEEHANATAEAIQKVGYKCIVATSGKAGLKIIETEEIDVVLCLNIIRGLRLAASVENKKHQDTGNYFIQIIYNHFH